METIIPPLTFVGPVMASSTVSDLGVVGIPSKVTLQHFLAPAVELSAVAVQSAATEAAARVTQASIGLMFVPQVQEWPVLVDTRPRFSFSAAAVVPV